MILYVPVTQFRVDFDIGVGRPYSELERLILRAVHDEGVHTLDGLRDVFQVHRRLIVEALVTLSHAGWIAVGRNAGEEFVLTDTGREAALAHGRVPDFVEIRSDGADVLLELLDGAVAPRSGISFVHDNEIPPAHAPLKLAPQVIDTRLATERVRDIVRRKAETRRPPAHVRAIGQVRMTTRLCWVPVDARPRQQRVDFLPQTWSKGLTPLILEAAEKLIERAKIDRDIAWILGDPDEARKETRSRRDRAANDVASEVGGCVTDVAERDLLFTYAEHREYLHRALSKADTSILVASAFVSARAIDNMKSAVLDAVQRGVKVYFLWGYSTGEDAPSGEAMARLREIHQSVAERRLPGGFSFNSEPCGSHAKLLLWDTKDEIRACVGSYNWLTGGLLPDRTMGSAQRLTNVSVELHAPRITSVLCQCAGSLWSLGRTEGSVLGAERWHRFAAELDRRASTTSLGMPAAGACTASLIFDREHDTILRGQLAGATLRVLVLSHKVGPVAKSRLWAGFNRKRTEGFHYRVAYGETLGIDAAGIDGLQDLLAASVGPESKGLAELLHLADMHAKVLIADDNALITSYNLLSADPSQDKTRMAREIGVLIEGNAFADALYNRLFSETVATPPKESA